MQGLLTKISFNWTYDTIILIFLVVAAFLYGLSIGRRRMIIILLATYLAFAVSKVTPLTFIKTLDLGSSGIAGMNIAVFVVYTILFYLLLSGSRLADFFGLFPMKGLRHWWQVFVLGILQTGLLLSIILNLFPEGFDLKIAPFTELFLTKDIAVFLWFIAPIFFLAFLRQQREGGEETGE